MRPVRTLLIASFVVIILLVGIVTFDRSILNEYFIGLLVQHASERGVSLTVASLTPFFTGISATSLKIILTKALLSFQLDSLSTDCAPFDLIQGRARCTISSAAYDGTAKGDLTVDSSGGDLKNAEITDLKLANHPQLLGFGIEQGIFSAKIPDAVWNDKGLISLNGAARIKNFSKPGTTRLSPRLTGLPIPIELPPFSAEQVSVDFSAAAGSLNLSNISITSTLGTLGGSASFPISGLRTLPTLSLVLNLTESGVTTLRPHLMFLCESSLLQAGTPLKISSSPGSPTPRCARN